MEFRQERESDKDEIYSFVKTVFSTADVSDGNEQDYQAKLRDTKQNIPELTNVMVENGKIIGHVMISKVKLETESGPREELLLAILSVDIDHRRKGVGTALVTRTLEKAREMGFGGIFVCGSPKYYGRFGFEESANFGIRSKEDVPKEVVLALELKPGELKSNPGVFSFF